MKSFPETLSHLKAKRYRFSERVLSKLPNLTKLAMDYESAKDRFFPDTLTRLTITGLTVTDNLPPKLTHLSLKHSNLLPNYSLPNTLTHLTLGFRTNMPLDNLPNSLKYLHIEEGFRQNLDNLPNSITHLTIENSSYGLSRKCPANLKFFSIEGALDFPVTLLPSTLETLIIEYRRTSGRTPNRIF